MKRAYDNWCTICVVMCTMLMEPFLVCAGEFYGRRDPRHDGQEAEHPQHVRNCPRRPRKVDAYGLAGLEGRYHRRSPRRRDPLHGHPQR